MEWKILRADPHKDTEPRFPDEFTVTGLTQEQVTDLCYSLTCFCNAQGRMRRSCERYVATPLKNT